MVDLHDEAERLALAFVREFKRTYPGQSPSQAMASFGARGHGAAAVMGWDDVVIAWARNWLQARRAADAVRR